MFEKGPRTRNMSGACTPVSTRNFNALGRYLAHHTLAALTQNSCRCEYLRPGNKLSSSLRRRIHLSEKETTFVLLHIMQTFQNKKVLKFDSISPKFDTEVVEKFLNSISHQLELFQ